MAKALFLTFIALSGAGVAFADYTNQSIKVGVNLGELSFGEYVGTYRTRYTGMVSGWEAEALANELRSKDMRENLPAGVDGWEMREWNEADHARLFPPTDAPEVPAELQEVLDENMVFANLQAAGEREALADEQAETRFYQKGDSLIALRLSYRSPQRDVGGMQGLALNIIEGNMAAMSGNEGFAVIKGVSYGRSTGLFGAEDTGEETRVITGRMGDEIKIAVRAQASDEDIHALLSSIDYDQLNTMMVRPLDDVGSDAADIPLHQQRGVAEAMIAAEKQELMDRARESEAAIVAMGNAITNGADAVSGDANTGGLGGLFGQSSTGTASTGSDAAPAQVRRLGDGADGNCTMIGARKSCGVQTD
jgi:hypothetical protein